MMKNIEQWRFDGGDGEVDGGGRKKRTRLCCCVEEENAFWFFRERRGRNFVNFRERNEEGNGPEMESADIYTQMLVETMRLPNYPSLKLHDYQNAPQKGKMVISRDKNCPI